MKPVKKSKKSDKEPKVKKSSLKKSKDSKDSKDKAKSSKDEDKKASKESGKAKSSSPVPTVPLPPAPAVIKLPYPVINDRRDMSTILGTLETKRKELLKKLEENKTSLHSSKTKSSDKRQKLKLLKQSLESQREKIEMQLDYVRLALSLEGLRNLVNSNPAAMHTEGAKMASLSQQMNEMYNYMKNANKQYLKKQQAPSEQQPQVPVQPSSSQEKVGSTVPQVPPPRVPSPTEKVSSQYEVVCNSLASLIAHTAATAHSAAAIAYMNYYHYTAYQKQQEQLELQQQQKKAGGGKKKDAAKSVDTSAVDLLPPMRPLVPLKSELEKASSVFAKYKNKISSFFEVSTTKPSKKTPQETSSSKKVKDEMSGLKLLLQAYSRDDDAKCSSSSDGSDSEDEPMITESKPAPEAAQVQVEIKQQPKKPADSSDSDSDTDDLEIVTTSELKTSQTQRNYLVPSIKASYFPLKASLESASFRPCAASLIAAEKSKHALTFLGRPSSIYIGQHQSGRTKLADILYSSKQQS